MSRYWFHSLTLVLAYVVTGYVGLLIPAFGTSITLIWLPTGIAVAFLYQGGFRYWPAVSIGAVCVNLANGVVWPAAAAIAIGNTLGPLLTAWLLRRLEFQPRLERIRDIILLAVTAHAGMLISASNGVAVLAFFDRLEEGLVRAWLSWWAGDSMGVIAAAPFLLVAGRTQLETIQRRLGEFLLWLMLTMLVTFGIFVLNGSQEGAAWAIAFVPFPLIAWATMRFGATGTSAAVILIALVAAYGTSVKSGPFYRVDPMQQVLLLWVYMTTMATLGWLIAVLGFSQFKAIDIQRNLEHGLRNANLGFLLADGNGLITYVNDCFTRLTGYTTADLLGRECRILQGSGTDAETVDQIRMALSSGGHFDGEILNYRKDGSAFWNALVISPIYGDDGKLEGFLVTQRDITAKKKSEIALQRSESRLRTILELEPECVKIVSRDGCLIEMNRAGLEMIEADSIDQVRGVAIDELIVDEYRASFNMMHERVLAGDHGHCEFPIIGLHGTHRWLESNSVPYRDFDGAIIGQLAVTRDTTNHKLAMKALQESRDQIDRILNSIEVVVYSASPAGDEILFISDYAETLYGSPAREFRDDPTKWFSVIHPDDREYVEKAFAAMEVTGSFNLEYRIIRADGSVRWLLNRSRMILDSDGVRLRLDGVVSDVTDRKSAELELRASEVRYRQLFKANPHPMWVYDLDSLRFLAVNTAAICHYGFSREEFLAMTIKDIRPPEDIPALLLNVSQSGGTIDKAGTWRHRIKDGTLIDVEITSHPLIFDDRAAELVLANDVTDRRRLEEQVRATQERFQAIVERSHDLILIFDGEGYIRFVNPASRDILGFEPEEMIGRHNLEFVTSADRMQKSLEAAEILQSPGREFRTEIRAVHRDGIGRTLDAIGINLIDVPSLSGLVVNCRDITERKEAEERTANELMILESLATGASIETVLAQIVRNSEQTCPGMKCSVLLADEQGTHLVHGVSPGLPEAFRQSVNGIRIGPDSGSCGTAAHTRTRVIVSDIATDPLWADYRDIALRHGLEACWSTPMFSSNGKLLGTFAMYYSQPQIPTSAEISVIDRGVYLAVLAIERSQLLSSIRESRIRLETLVGNLPGMAYRCQNDAARTMTYVSSGCEQITGFQRNELEQHRNFAFADLIHPEDRKQLWADREKSFDAHVPSSNTYRILDKGGRTRWVRERAMGVYAEDGALLCIDGFVQDITESRRIEQQVRASLEEKEAMLREIHHRVKNNLQIISSLLNLQLDKVADAAVQMALRESQNRVRSMALVHETLYQSGNLGRIDLAEYVRALCGYLFRSYGIDTSVITLTLEVSNCSLDLDRAIPFGLIINELVSNSLKYAFPEGRSGNVKVEFLAETNQDYALIVSDDGIGLSESLDLAQLRSLGLTLVQDLIRQLSGNVTFSRRPNTVISIRFPACRTDHEGKQ